MQDFENKQKIRSSGCRICFAYCRCKHNFWHHVYSDTTKPLSALGLRHGAQNSIPKRMQKFIKRVLASHWNPAGSILPPIKKFNRTENTRFKKPLKLRLFYVAPKFFETATFVFLFGSEKKSFQQD
jgi:hypothetical protein